MNFCPQKETGISSRKRTCTFFMFRFFGGDGGVFELFTIKFASDTAEYPISVTCGVESAQCSCTVP